MSAVTPEQRIVTIEGLSPDGSHPVQKAVAARNGVSEVNAFFNHDGHDVDQW